MNVSYIWFDLGLTLLRNNHCSLYQEALEAAGIHCELAAVEKAYHLANKYFMRERPGLLGKPERGRTDYSETLFDFLGLSFENPEADGYAGDRTTCLQIFEKELEEIQCRLFWEKFPFTDSVLEELHEKGIGTGLISNWDIHCRDILRATGLIDQPDTVVISSEVGYEKPAREIFEIALKNPVGKRRNVFM